MSDTMLVRIHPVNPQRGFHAATYLLANSRYPAFRVERGWYEVDKATANYLKEKRNNPADDNSKPIFQVCTKDEAVALDEAEIQRVAAATAPIPMPIQGRTGVRASSFVKKGEAVKKQAKPSHFAKDDEPIETATGEEAFDEEFGDEDLAPPIPEEPVTKPGKGRDMTTADLKSPPENHHRPEPVPAHRQSDGKAGSATAPVAMPAPPPVAPGAPVPAPPSGLKKAVKKVAPKLAAKKA